MPRSVPPIQPVSPATRLIAIDAFRAVTMLLMIFVNDFWTLQDIPGWLSHTKAEEDGMGFSDVIFPAFLFIVGLSIPIAVQNRLKKGDTPSVLAIHIALRSAALLIMGFFHVNLGSYSAASWMPLPVWEILITISFFLIWLDYPQTLNKRNTTILKVSGIILLAFLALIYKGDSSDGISWMRPKWWGILGLIGWAYLIVSMVFLLTKGKLAAQFIAFIFFMALSAAEHTGLLQPLSGIREYIWIVESGSLPALVMAGVITSMFYRKFSPQSRNFWFFITAASVIMLLFGFMTRPEWGISKIRATPSWTAICIAVSAASFAFIVYLTDLKGKKKWYGFIKPAGISTLTCYLLPYLHSAFFQMADVQLPAFLRTGAAGLLKSFIFALLIIKIAGLLGKWNIRLKL